VYVTSAGLCARVLAFAGAAEIQYVHTYTYIHTYTITYTFRYRYIKPKAYSLQPAAERPGLDLGIRDCVACGWLRWKRKTTQCCSTITRSKLRALCGRAVELCSPCLWWGGKLCRRCAAGGCARAVLVLVWGCTYMYVKIRRHQHTRVHAHTGPRRHTRAPAWVFLELGGILIINHHLYLCVYPVLYLSNS